MPSWTKCAIPDTRENNKTCFANQKILLGAIEMYNMDVPNDQKIKTLDNEAIINKLVEKNYLNKKNFNKSKEDCVFLSKGDLTKDGFVFCKKHGNDKDKKEKTFDFFIKIDSWVGKIVSIILYPIELLLEKDSAFSTVLAISIAFLGLIQASWGNFDASIKYYCSGIVYFIIILLIYFFFIKRDDE